MSGATAPVRDSTRAVIIGPRVMRVPNAPRSDTNISSTAPDSKAREARCTDLLRAERSLAAARLLVNTGDHDWCAGQRETADVLERA